MRIPDGFPEVAQDGAGGHEGPALFPGAVHEGAEQHRRHGEAHVQTGIHQSVNASGGALGRGGAALVRPGHAGDVERCWCTYFNGIGSGGDSQLTVENRIKFARADLEGVLAADVVWLLAANDKGACGSWVELGAALAAVELRRAQLGSFGGVQGIAPVIVVSGPKCRRTVFTEIAQHLVEDDDEALKLIVKMHEERSGVRAALGT